LSREWIVLAEVEDANGTRGVSGGETAQEEGEDAEEFHGLVGCR
jgi:hypothetical protein